MKNLMMIILCFLSIGSIAQAQKKKPVKKTTIISKTIPAKTKVTTKQLATDEKNSIKTVKAAVGLKFIYGVSLTGKVFIKENSALEGIFRYNSGGGLGSNIAFTGLYEYHAPIKGVDGLRWYLGGGGHVNYFSWKDSNADAVTTFGVAGIVGLEYKFANLPLAVSADWQPAYIISSPSGFSAENGGIGIKYTF